MYTVIGVCKDVYDSEIILPFVPQIYRYSQSHNMSKRVLVCWYCAPYVPSCLQGCSWRGYIRYIYMGKGYYWYDVGLINEAKKNAVLLEMQNNSINDNATKEL